MFQGIEIEELQNTSQSEVSSFAAQIHLLPHLPHHFMEFFWFF